MRSFNTTDRLFPLQGLSPVDLTANRSGRLSETQRERLRAAVPAAWRLWALALLFSPFLLMALSRPILLVLALPVFALPIGLLAALRWRCSTDVSSGVVRTVEGQVAAWRYRRPRHSPAYVSGLVVGSARLRGLRNMSSELVRACPPGTRVRAYVTERSGFAVGIEAL
jgi:hypothetical protein